MQLPDHAVIRVLTDGVAKLEQAKHFAHTTVITEIKSEGAPFECNLSDIRNTNDTPLKKKTT